MVTRYGGRVHAQRPVAIRRSPIQTGLETFVHVRGTIAFGNALGSLPRRWIAKAIKSQHRWRTVYTTRRQDFRLRRGDDAARKRAFPRSDKVDGLIAGAGCTASCGRKTTSEPPPKSSTLINRPPRGRNRPLAPVGCMQRDVGFQGSRNLAPTAEKSASADETSTGTNSISVDCLFDISNRMARQVFRNLTD